MDYFEQYRQHLDELPRKAMRYPYHVSIETWAICNASCNFCPYPGMERKGDKMPDELFYRIIDELASGETQPEIITLARVNEPFVDNRIFKFAGYINNRLPNSKLFFFSNASPLHEKNIDSLLTLRNIGLLNISFNDHRKDEYEKAMGIPYEKTLANLEILHEKLKARRVAFQTRISRVGDGSAADAAYAAWAREKFPLFSPMVSMRCDWMGALRLKVTDPVPSFGCSQWFQLHILADGRKAFCCIDAEGALSRGNAHSSHVIDLYNQPEMLPLRSPGLSRADVPVCANCVLRP